MSQQILNFSQKVVDLLKDNWTLTGKLKAESVHFAGFQMQPDKRFQRGKDIVVEVYKINTPADPQSQGITEMNTLISIDLWLRVIDGTDKGRQKAEDDMALLENKVASIIHDNQLVITGFRLTTFSNFTSADEVEESPIKLHRVMRVRGQWYHTKS